MLPLHYDPLVTGGRCVSGEMHAAYFNSYEKLGVECRTDQKFGLPTQPFTLHFSHFTLLKLARGGVEPPHPLYQNDRLPLHHRASVYRQSLRTITPYGI